MARRKSSRSSSRLSVAPTTEDVASVNEPATASVKDQRSKSDTPYSAEDNGETREEAAAPSSELEHSQGSSSNAQAASDSSGREVENGQLPPVQMNDPDDGQAFTKSTGTSITNGPAPAQQIEQQTEGNSFIHVATRAKDNDTPPTQPQGECPGTSTLRPDTNGNQDTTTGDHEGRRKDLDDGRLPYTTDEQGRVQPNDFKVMLNADGGRAYAKPAEKEELTGWARFAEEVWTFEDKRMERWKDDINYLLLYAGLFSTALTGFIVPFYGFQAQAVDPTVQALALIAMQLNVIALSVGHTNLTQQLPSPILPPSAAPAGRPLLTGILWTIALILSLVSGAIAIIVSQWLHHHVNRATVLVGALVGALLVTALIPVIAASCPFKSPQAWWWLCFVRLLHTPLLLVMRSMSKFVGWVYWKTTGVLENIAYPVWNGLNSMCGTLDEWHQLSNWTDFDNRSLAMLADADAIVTDVSFLEKVVRPCIQQQKLEDIEDTLSAYYDIMEHRAHHIDRSQSPPWLTWDSSEQDSGTIETLVQISVDVLSQIPETLLLADDTPKAHVKRFDNILRCLLRAIPRAESAVHSRLIRLLPTPELPHVVQDMLVDIIASCGGQYRLDIEDTRRLLTFLPHARERLSTGRFLWIACSALRHSARLPPDDFGRVHSNVRGTLDVVVEYFSSSGIEEVTQAYTWGKFSILLDVCVELSQVDTAQSARNGQLFTREVVNALERCASRFPENGYLGIYIRDGMKTIRSTVGYSAGSIRNEPVAGVTVNPAPAPQDVDEAPREHPEVVGDTPMQ
ncbi:predicted protein [Postia placenta Mad-698-R]|uniref:DUF6535 domain-containing protein n=1 Tax=Postia placenta MAD-698-R-SB12 TaxID=670580 RepID=A0A1X6MKJ9_9APHY|nr:hypothetical protein POSPLADRAFT_1159497 [Postia placenta MAD-698-R-SB12]EED78706.1 predicted protein [Postia placenta Mad-698-R]OSX56573.1 hypothetical protein POSPLADRAFT_1159497 [Postia placenta MAD-698-R-SB12]